MRRSTALPVLALVALCAGRLAPAADAGSGPCSGGACTRGAKAEEKPQETGRKWLPANASSAAAANRTAPAPNASKSALPVANASVASSSERLAVPGQSRAEVRAEALVRRGARRGGMTMWSNNPDIIVGSSCEYANGRIGGVRSPAARSPYVRSRSYCAVDAALYRQGEACGSCYRISYDGSPATDPGRPGSHIIQVVDSGSEKTFDCQVTAFKHITGQVTGIFPIRYEPVRCDTGGSLPRATVIDGVNPMYGRVVFSNFPRAVAWAKMYIDRKRFRLARNFGTWRANTDGTRGKASFKVGLFGGRVFWFEGCVSWPMRRGDSCSTRRWGRRATGKDGGGEEGLATEAERGAGSPAPPPKNATARAGAAPSAPAQPGVFYP